MQNSTKEKVKKNLLKYLQRLTWLLRPFYLMKKALSKNFALVSTIFSKKTRKFKHIVLY